jgi:hypothetical protein
MDTDTLNFIQQTSTLHNHIVENKIIGVIVNELQAIPELKNLKMSLDLLLHIALMLENMTHDNRLLGRPKGYKSEMAIKIFEKLGFINREEDKQFIINGLNFLHSAGKIKRLGFFKRLFAKAYNFLSREAIRRI